MNSAIKQSADNITTNVNKTFEDYSTTTEMNSAINQTAESINTEVKKKVGNNEVISKINQSAESVQIDASKVSLVGKTINMTSDDININSNNFKVDKSGKMTCADATITGGDLNLPSTNLTSTITLYEKDHPLNKVYMNSYYIFVNSEEIGGTSVSIGTGRWGTGYAEGTITLWSNEQDYTLLTAREITTPKLTQTSRAEFKKNFEKLENGLDIVENTEIYKYNFNSQQDDEKKHI